MSGSHDLLDLPGGAPVAVVTGGGSGIGAAIARAVAVRRVRPVVADVDPGAAERVAESSGGRALRVDVADPDQVELLARSAPQARWVFLSAGLLGEHLGPPWEAPPGVAQGARRQPRRGGQRPARVRAPAAGGGGARPRGGHGVAGRSSGLPRGRRVRPVRARGPGRGPACGDGPGWHCGPGARGVPRPRAHRHVAGRDGPGGGGAAEVARHALALVDGGGSAWVPPPWRDAVRQGAADLAAGDVPRPPQPSAPAAALLLNGTVGAGTTTTAEHVGRVLADQGVPHAGVDLDELRRAWPAPETDPFHQRLELADLRDVAANHRRAGARRLVLSGVLEDRASRERYERALGVPLVVGLRADVATTQDRLAVRHRDDDARRWHVHRCAELHEVLQRAGVDDHVVDVDGLTPPQVAAAVLRTISAGGAPRWW